MLKTNVYLTKENVAKLGTIQKARGQISMAAAIRMAISAYRLPRRTK